MMNRTLNYAWALSILLFACSKKEETPAPTPGGNTPIIAADAVLNAHWVENGEDNASAIFLANDTTTVAVGNVTLNNVTPDGSSSGVYNWNTTPLDVSANVTWVVPGGTGFTGFTREVNDIPLPQIDDIDSGNEVHRNSGYLLSCTGVSAADSLRFTVHFGVSKTLAGDVTSCFFTPGELAIVPDGPTQCVVTGISYRNETIGGKRVQFERSSGQSMGVVVSD